MTNPGAAALAALLRRHAPQARRFLSWKAGAGAANLLGAARSLGEPDWVHCQEPDEARIAPLLALLPPDPCLHLRGIAAFELPQPGFAHPILRRWQQGLQPEVILLGPEAILPFELQVAARVLPPGGLVVAPLPDAASAETIAPLLEMVESTDSLGAWRPRRGAPPPPRRPPGRCAIVVTVVGAQTEAEWEITGPSVRAYADAIGAELVISRDGAGLPGPTLKALAVPLAEAFDRVVMMDADILVRPHAPDLFALVPPDRVGAYPEARHFQRAEVAAGAAAMHRVPPFPAEDYFNAGLMVLSRAHLGIVRAVGHGHVGGIIPEQDTINAELHRLALPLHRIEPEFNLIATGRNLSDWRCGWMLHTAGAPKRAMVRRFGWRRQDFPGGAVWTRQPFTGRSLRLPHMAAQAARIAGQEAIAIDPDEMDLAPPRGFARIMPDGVAAIWLEPAAAGDAERPARIAFDSLAPGRWRVVALPVPEVPLADCALRVTEGDTALLAERLGPEASFDLAEGAGPVDVALGGDGAGGAVAGLLLLRDLMPTIRDWNPPPPVPASP